MSLTSFFLPNRNASNRDPLSGFWYGDIGRPTSSRVSVTEDTAMTYSAVWAATRLLSGTGAMLALNLYQRKDGARPDSTPGDRGDDSEFILRNDRRNRLVESRPNDEMNAMMFRAQGFQQQINAGNCYSEIVRVGRQVDSLWPIHHTRVKAVRDKDGGDLWYEVKNNVGEPTYIAPGDMLHVPSMMSKDGITGIGVIANARESIGAGIAAERHAASTFGNGAIPRVIVSHPTKLSPEARQNFRNEWKEIYGGADGDKVALLSEGAKAEPLNVSMADMQFIESRQFGNIVVAQWYGVPPHMIQYLLNSNYSTTEHMGIEFVVYSLMPWLVLWEQELWAKLLTPEEQETMFFRFNVTELLRGDAKTRAEYLRTLIQIGMKTPNEGRRMEGDNPFNDPAADKLYMQGAMCEIGKLGQKNVPQLPQTADEQQGVDTQGRAAMLAIVAEQTQAVEQRAVAAVATMVNAANASVTTAISDLTARLDALAQVRDTRETALKQAARTMLTGALARMVRNQATAARREAKKPGTFLAWLDGFFDGDHRKNFSEAVEPVTGALAAMGITVDARTLADTQVNESRQELLDLSGTCSATDLAARVDERMVEWERDRAAKVCEAVMGGTAT